MDDTSEMTRTLRFWSFSKPIVLTRSFLDRFWIVFGSFMDRLWIVLDCFCFVFCPYFLSGLKFRKNNCENNWFSCNKRILSLQENIGIKHTKNTHYYSDSEFCLTSFLHLTLWKTIFKTKPPFSTNGSSKSFKSSIKSQSFVDIHVLQ